MTAVCIIAEAGVNHNGDIELARRMVGAAVAAGADVVKFQAFSADSLVAAGTATARYQRANTGISDQKAMLKSLGLRRDDFAELAAECRRQNIEFLCTAFDIEMLEELISFGMRRIKVASGELTNTPALRRVAGLGLPILLSTGMASLDEVARAVDVLREGDAGADITLLHCTSLYPAPDETANLNAMRTMRERFRLPVGYSDHTMGDHVTIAAVALGATVIEKHFTLDRSLPGPDHIASLEPAELASLVQKVRGVERALGDGVKQPQPGEVETARLVRRGWHAARPLASGTVIGEQDVALKRPAEGLPPETSPVGRTLRRALTVDAPVGADDLA